MNVNKPTTEKKLIDLNNDIIHNFDVSIVMSFYKRYTEFKKVLPHNAPYSSILAYAPKEHPIFYNSP